MSYMDNHGEAVQFILEQCEQIERLRDALHTARQQIKTLGTPDDAINNAILAIIDKAMSD